MTDGFPLGLVEAFPDLSDDDLPEDLMCMHMTPDSSRWWLGGQEGQVVTVRPERKENRELYCQLDTAYCVGVSRGSCFDTTMCLTRNR